jgi:hypothetical protein
VIELLREEADGVLERPCEAASVAGPRNDFRLDLLALRTPEPADRALDPRRRAEDGEVTPSAGGLLEAALHLGAALRAGKESEAAVHIDHERIALKPDTPNR